MSLEDELKVKIREKVLRGFDYSENISDDELSDVIMQNINSEAGDVFLPLARREKLQSEVFNSIRGLDILDELLHDEDVSEIMVNGHENVFVEKAGKLMKTDKHFESAEKLSDIIQRIVAYANRTVNESNPICDARLQDGSRVNVVLKPVALNGPIVTIRKFSRTPLSMEKLIEMGAITREAADDLRKLVRAKYNLFISGGTGSGKTTFLNALCDYFEPTERIITIEDSAELRIRNIENLVSLEVRNSNSGECEEISIRDLIRNALRMRPNRILVGEVRGAEVIDMLQAMSTGHDGSLSTGHGNSIPDMLDRLETMTYLSGNEIPQRAVRKQISTAIDIMVHLGRLRDGSRKVLEIAEVLGISDGEIELNPLFVFKEDKKTVDEGMVQGRLIRTENTLVCRGKLRRAGIEWTDG